MPYICYFSNHKPKKLQFVVNDNTSKSGKLIVLLITFTCSKTSNLYNLFISICILLIKVFSISMANSSHPRKFSEKMAVLNQRQAIYTAETEGIIREVAELRKVIYN